MFLSPSKIVPIPYNLNQNPGSAIECIVLCSAHPVTRIFAPSHSNQLKVNVDMSSVLKLTHQLLVMAVYQLLIMDVGGVVKSYTVLDTFKCYFIIHRILILNA